MMTTDTKISLISSQDKALSVRKQCELLDLHRTNLYYQPVGETAENLLYMRLIDEEFMQHPFYGVARMHQILLTKGYQVNEKRVRRLCRLMGLEAIYPKPNLSKMSEDETVKYPYLLRGIRIEKVNQVWSTDITYIPMQQGFMYLTAVIDWYSRYVLAWDVSNTMETDFCMGVLKASLMQNKPEIFNTDQGSQYTSLAFTGHLLANEIKISWDGKGRALDNIFVERLWRTVKYEHIYLHSYRDGKSLRKGLTEFFKFYNQERLHQSLDYQTPEQVYRQFVRPSRSAIAMRDEFSKAYDQ